MVENSCATCGGGSTASNTNNGAGSNNNASNNTSNTNTTDQFNNANIDNNLVLNGETGDNDTNYNTNGDSNVDTGDVNLVANVLNIANTNISDGTMWLVIVNEAGKWVGRIMGAPEGQNYAGSTEFEFDVAEDGSVTAKNDGNGAGSNNNTSNNSSNNTSVEQNNNADIENNINLSANTGGNNANYNTGGTNTIKTGDATVIANIVNFVNNNITGNGKLVVTVVNVFGSWMGDLVTPGQKKAPIAQGNSNNSNSNTGVGGNSENNNSTNATTSKSTSTTAIVAQNTTQISTRGFVASAGSLLAYATSDTKVQANNKVKGISTSNEIVASANQTTINLAWALVLLPIVLVAFKLRKRFIKKTI
jgi:hypothetical protein